GVKLEEKGVVGSAVERALDSNARGRDRDARQKWKVLKVVRSRIAIALVIGEWQRPEGRIEVDSFAGVPVDRVAEDDVAGALLYGAAGGARARRSAEAVERDHVLLAHAGPSDRRPSFERPELDSGAGVGDRSSADSDAHEVSLNHVSGARMKSSAG